MDVKSYMSVLRRRRWVIILTTVLTLSVALGLAYFLSPVYESSLTLQLPTAEQGSIGAVRYDLDYTDRLMNTYLYVARSGPVIKDLMARFSLDEPPRVDAKVLANTELIQLTAEANQPELAPQLVTALAERLINIDGQTARADIETKRQALDKQLAQLERELGEMRQASMRLAASGIMTDVASATFEEELAAKRETYGVLLARSRDLGMDELVRTRSLKIVDPAVVPLEPIFPNIRLLTALGLVLGLIAGIGLAFLMENLDTTLHSVDEIQGVTQLAILAAIPHSTRVKWPNIIMSSQPSREDAFDRLYATLWLRIQDAPSHIILVTSAQPCEGKSTVTANLGTAMALAGHSVLAVDCNMYNPSLHKIFQLPNEVGFADIVQGYSDLGKAAQATGTLNLHVVTSDERDSNSIELWESARLKHLAQLLRAHSGIVLLDAPAIQVAQDALLLSSIADSILFVVGESVAHEESVRLARQALGSTNKLVGVVVNHSAQHEMHYRG